MPPRTKKAVPLYTFKKVGHKNRRKASSQNDSSTLHDVVKVLGTLTTTLATTNT